jgi:hypothetical protein
MASKTGYGVALAGFLGAVIAYATGDHSQAQLGSILSASVGLISLAVTQVGRYVQANTQIRADADLKRLLSEGTNVVHTIDHYDPGAIAELEAIVRSAVHDEVARLAGGSGTVAGEVAGEVVDDVAAEVTGQVAGAPVAGEVASAPVAAQVAGARMAGHADGPEPARAANPLLPTPEEEAAQPPPGAGGGDGSGSGSGSAGAIAVGAATTSEGGH